MTRQHIEHLAAAFGALAFALFISYFNTGAHAVNVATLATPHPSLTAVGSSTMSFSPGVLFAPTTFPDLIVPTSTFERTTTPSTPQRTITPSVASPIVTPQVHPPAPSKTVVQTTPATSTPPTPDTSALLAGIAPSVVNILCISTVPNLHSISGSGVIVSSNGVILTVAHVAQMVLLQEYLGMGKVSCIARTGNPAHAAYVLRPIYISSAWVHSNSTTLISSQPTGTGENDIALLGITGSATNAALPVSFPAVPLSSQTPSIGDAVGIGSYGAQDLSTEQVVDDLTPTLAASTVTDVYTFDTNTVDVLAVDGSIASQEGSSGGGIVNMAGQLVGVIVTSELSGSESTRELRAITLNYINRALEADIGESVGSEIDGKSVSDLVNSYAPTAQTLGQFLANALGLQS